MFRRENNNVYKYNITSNVYIRNVFSHQVEVHFLPVVLAFSLIPGTHSHIFRFEYRSGEVEKHYFENNTRKNGGV